MANPADQAVLLYYRDQEGGYRWRLTAPNGRIIAASTEGYKRKEDCAQNIVDIIQTLESEIFHRVEFDSAWNG